MRHAKGDERFVIEVLGQLIAESGNERRDFDLERWVADWMRQPLAELGGQTPKHALGQPEGLEAVKQILERMRGGLAA